MSEVFRVFQSVAAWAVGRYKIRAEATERVIPKGAHWQLGSIWNLVEIIDGEMLPAFEMLIEMLTWAAAKMPPTCPTAEGTGPYNAELFPGSWNVLPGTKVRHLYVIYGAWN